MKNTHVDNTSGGGPQSDVNGYLLLVGVILAGATIWLAIGNLGLATWATVVLLAVGLAASVGCIAASLKGVRARS